MKAWLRICSAAARASHSIRLCGLFMASKSRWRVGADDDGLVAADVAEAMRSAALEIIGLARTQHLDALAHGDLDLALDDHAALLAVVAERRLAGVAARRHHLAQDAHLAVAAAIADQEIVDVVVADVGQLLGLV